MDPEAILHPLVDLASPAFEAIRTDHEIQKAKAHVATMAQGPRVGTFHLPDPLHLHLNGSCGTNILAGSTGQALTGIALERHSDLFLCSPPGKTDRMGSHDFLAGADTETAQNTVISGIHILESASFDTEFAGQVLNKGHLRTTGE
jgi:small ligand-binding sensory domain FIST